MSLPSGLIFFLDFTFGTESTSPRMGNFSGSSIYGTDAVGSQITGGVSVVGAFGEDLSGPRNDVGYAYASPSASFDVIPGAMTLQSINLIDGLSEDNKKLLRYDPDVLSLVDAAGTYFVSRLQIPAANVTSDMGQLNLRNLSAIQCTTAQIQIVTTMGASSVQLRRLTDIDSSGNLYLYFIDDVTGGIVVGPGLTGSMPIDDGFTSAGVPIGAVTVTPTWGLEGSEIIPTIDIRVDSVAITTMSKKLKAKWTPELGQDLQAYHNLDAEVELTSILSEQIALEIDREILADLVNGATAATLYWSRSPGLFVNRVTGAQIGALSGIPDFTGTVSEWYETLIETINDVSAQIHVKTLRGGANFVVCSPEVANVLEFTAGFRANVTADDDKGVTLEQ